MFEQNKILYRTYFPLSCRSEKSFKLNDFDVESKTFVNNVLSFFFLLLLLLLGFMLFGCVVIVLKYYETTKYKWEDRDVFIF